MILKIESLTFEYPGVKALDCLSLDIDKGKITALVGPNGAGKTTLLKCVAGLIKPFAGNILIDGISIFEDPTSAKKNIGFLQDFFGLYDDLTVTQYLRYFYSAFFLPIESQNSRIEEILNDVDLLQKSKSKVGSLSRGMRQRLAIARTLLHKPKLLLLDEPASGLDPEARHELAVMFKELNQSGMSLIVSSHILSELDEYADSMIAIRDGKIISNEELESEPKLNMVLEVIDQIDSATFELSSNEFVSNMHHKGRVITFDFTGSESDSYELLKSLIASGAKVLNYTSKERNLQEEYLGIVKANQIFGGRN